jgi:hypothetical protein
VKKFASATLTVALALALAGCGSKSSIPASTNGSNGSIGTDTNTGTTPVPREWTGPPPAAKDGSIPIDGFNEWAEANISLDKRGPTYLAKRFVGPENAKGASVDVTNRTGVAAATVTRDNLEDDSVKAIRYELGFGLVTGGKWRLLTAKVEFQCHQGRGHADWSSELCA